MNSNKDMAMYHIVLDTLNVCVFKSGLSMNTMLLIVAKKFDYKPKKIFFQPQYNPQRNFLGQFTESAGNFTRNFTPKKTRLKMKTVKFQIKLPVKFPVNFVNWSKKFL